MLASVLVETRVFGEGWVCRWAHQAEAFQQEAEIFITAIKPNARGEVVAKAFKLQMTILDCGWL